jgi:hypothetical protein
MTLIPEDEQRRKLVSGGAGCVEHYPLTFFAWQEASWTQMVIHFLSTRSYSRCYAIEGSQKPIFT